MLKPILFAAIILLALLPQLARADADSNATGLVAHWKLDGDAKDALGASAEGAIQGHPSFIDSAVGAAGRLLVCNGVDTCATLPVGTTGPPAGPFAVSVWIFPLDMQNGGIIGRSTKTGGWQVDLRGDGSLHLRFPAGGNKAVDCATAAGALHSRQWYHVAICRDDSEHELPALFLNAKAVPMSGEKPGAVEQSGPVVIGRSDSGFYNGLIDDVRFYSRKLSQDEVASITDEGLPWLRDKPENRQPFSNGFTLKAHDVVMYVGGENMSAASEAGFLETSLTAAMPGKQVLFRSMAWDGDTAFEQWRIINFGSWTQSFERFGASVLMVQFGQMEALKGSGQLQSFIIAYEKLLDEFQARTPRIVLISPTPFEKAGGDLPDLSKHNDDLRLYVDAIHALATKRQLLFVDLFTPLLKADRRLTRDGLHLSLEGQRRIAGEMCRQLQIKLDPKLAEINSGGVFQSPQVERLRQQVLSKNRLWVEYLRPTNWAFLNGDRVSQPSSRDPQDPRIRWFPPEIEQFQALIMRAEMEIAAQTQKLAEEPQH